MFSHYLFIYIILTSPQGSPAPGATSVALYFLIQTADPELEPDPDFHISIHISETYHRIFICDTSYRRPGQGLHFIQLERRPPTSFWGRYDPKTEILTVFRP